jgi:LPXTG-motif cell wall-anchored protein
MRRALKALTIGAALLTLGLAPITVTAQDGQGQGQVGGVSIDASGTNEVRSSDAGESRQTTINNRPGNTSVNEAAGQGNQEEVRTNRRAERQAQREAERAAAAEAAPAADQGAWEPAPEAAPAPVEEAAPAPEAAPAAAPVTSLPSTGTGAGSQAPAALAMLLSALAAVGAFVTFRRAREA